MGQVKQLGGHSGVWAGHLGGRVEMVQKGQIQDTFKGPGSRGLWVDWSGV